MCIANLVVGIGLVGDSMFDYLIFVLIIAGDAIAVFIFQLEEHW